MGNAVVLDSSAVIAVRNGERGGESVIDLLGHSLVSSVNLTEIHTRAVLDGADSTQAWERVLRMGFEVVVHDLELARIAAEIARHTRDYGLSLGDRACLALAIQRQATAYTADRAWANLSLGIQIQMIR